MLTSLGFAALTFSVGALAQWAPSLVLRMSQLLYIDDPSKAYRYVILYVPLIKDIHCTYNL